MAFAVVSLCQQTAMFTHRCAHYLADLRLAGFVIHELQKRPAHARVPEFFEVVGQPFLRFGAVGHGFEKHANLVGHADQVVGVHKDRFRPILPAWL